MRTWRFEYKVLELRDKWFKGRQTSEALEIKMNEMAQHGWQFRFGKQQVLFTMYVDPPG